MKPAAYQAVGTGARGTAPPSTFEHTYSNGANFRVVIVAGSYSQEGPGAMGAGMGHDAPALARRHSWHGLLHATEQEAPMILQPQHREAAAGLVGPEISDDSN